MKAGYLERAIYLRDVIKSIDGFLSGYNGGDVPWLGAVHLQFGSYECEVGGAVHNDLGEILLTERKCLAAELEEFGVEIEQR